MKNVVLTKKVNIFILALLTIFIISFITSCTFKLSAAKAQETTIKGKISFASNRDGNYEIHIMNTDGSGQVDLTNNPAVDNFPSFSH